MATPADLIGNIIRPPKLIHWDERCLWTMVAEIALLLALPDQVSPIEVVPDWALPLRE